MTDSVALLQDLIRQESVTPNSAGAIAFFEKYLASHGFNCHHLSFSETGTPDIENFYARYGTDGPNICFAGHLDVVPVGEEKAWTADPFGGEIRDGYIWGRGAADMKGGVAAFAAAAVDYIKNNKTAGSISFLITGDEEGPSINGTKKVVDWLATRGEKVDFCVLGEPTSQKVLGDTVKIGRRGSLSGHLTVTGVQGHVAYPHLADNPVPKLLKILNALEALELDQGSDYFEPSNLEIITIDIGNKVTNVIPEKARAAFNIRFNDRHNTASLEKTIRASLDACKVPYEIAFSSSGDSFYTAPGAYSGLITGAIERVTGRKAELSTGGGTSDARFIKNFCPVIEFGIVGDTMHKVDERVAVEDMQNLTKIYGEIIAKFFA